MFKTKVFYRRGEDCEALEGKQTQKAISAIIEMIDTVMHYVAGGHYDYYSRCVGIEDIDLHSGSIYVGWGEQGTNGEGIEVLYDLEKGTLTYTCWGIREGDNCHDTIENPWDQYRKIISGIEYDIKKHVESEHLGGSFTSRWF
jgi:hypothetical protein